MEISSFGKRKAFIISPRIRVQDIQCQRCTFFIQTPHNTHHPAITVRLILRTRPVLTTIHFYISRNRFKVIKQTLMTYAGRSIKGCILATVFIPIGRDSYITGEMYACTLIHFPASHKVRTNRPPLRVTFVSRRRVLITCRQILFLINGRKISVPVQIIVHTSGQGEFLTEFMSHIHSYRIVDIILVRTILVSVGRLCDKRKIISVFTKIIHLPLEILLLVIPVSYRCICQPGFIQFILSLQVEYIFLFS